MRHFCLAVLLVLGGCDLVRDVQLQPKVDHANQQMAAARIDCDARFPPARGTYLAHAQCVDAAQRWVLRPLLPYPDLLDLQQTNREALAARADRGEIDPGEVARLTGPEDAPLRVSDSTLTGPLTRSFPPAYYAPAAQPFSTKCEPRYGFTDCNN